MPRLACTVVAVAGKVLSGVEVATMIRSIVDGSQPGCFERPRRGLGGEVGGHLAFGRDMALPDAGALDDPFVGGVDDLGQFLVA